jgi:hypothetical protein
MHSVYASHLCATWALVGLIWTVQLVLYPMFSSVGPAEFKSYHKRHTTRITWVVAPLMLVELLTVAWMLLGGKRDLWLLLSIAPLGFNWLSTWLVQVPLHERLSSGFDPRAHQRLVGTNWWRTLSWTLRGFAVLMASN